MVPLDTLVPPPRVRAALGALLLTLVAASALAFVGTASPAAAQLTCAQGGECELGDTGPGGGVVFFVKGTGAFSASRHFPDTSHMCVMFDMCDMENTVTASLTSDQQAALPFDYLEVAPLAGEVGRSWSVLNLDVPAAATRSIGAGAANSQAILDAGATDASLYAAAYARSYSNNGFEDWYLPSIDELALILVRQAVDGGAMGAFHHTLWSSTQNDYSGALIIQFTSGSSGYSWKVGGPYGVRPIRSFSPAPPAPTTTAAPTTSTTTTALPATTTTASPVPTTTAAPVTTTTALTEAGAAALPTRSLDVPSTVRGGQEITVRGSGFLPGSLIDVYVASEPVLLGRVTANLDGTFTLAVTLPSTLTGAHSIVLYDPATGTGFRQAIQIEGNSLAITGGSGHDGLMLALGLLMAGAACTIAARRRNALAR